MHTLYLCYFGLREPLVQTQVLPYLRQLRLDNIDVSLLTFEPELTRRWSDEERLKWEDSLKSDGVNWTALPYHKKPTLPATLFDIAIGTLKALRMVRFEQVDVLHARTHVPLAMALLARKLTGCKVVFDIRGLIADEYVDAGLWREGSLVYRAIKWLERIGIREADQVIVLTELMRDWLTEQKLCSAEKIEVVPCCVDFSRFDHKSLDIERDHNDADRFEVIYAGAVTGLYLLEEMGRFFLALREKRKNAFLRILTTSSAAEGKERLRRIGLDEKEFWIGKAHPAEVPGYLSRAKVGLSFRKTSFSQIAASPTKIPEYLAAGLPVVTNAGIGDSDQIIKSGRVGVVIDELNCEAYQRGVEELEDVLRDPTIVERCRKVARSRFDLEEVGGARYRRIYQRLAGVSSRRLTELPASQEVKV